MFCSACGSSVVRGDSFCSSCGYKLGGEPAASDKHATVKLLGSQMRVPYASITLEDVMQMGDEPFEFDASSPEAQRANAPFNAAAVPNDGDLVPLDCGWAYFRHPGPFKDSPGAYGSLDKKFVAMGELRGRRFEEIVAAAGLPMADVNTGEYRQCVWGKTGLFSVWQVGIRFDKYGVCMGVFSETNF